MAYENPFEIKTKSDGSYFGQPTSRSSYTNPVIGTSLIRSASGGGSNNSFHKENNSAINKANAQLADPQSGFNRGLKKRIKGAGNIAQQTKLKIKLDKKERNQEKRAQKKLDRNPEYTREAEKERGSKMKKVQNIQANTTFHPTNTPKLREI